MVLASYLSAAFVVGAVGSWHLLRDPWNAPARVMLSMAMWMALLVAPLILFGRPGILLTSPVPLLVAALAGGGRGIANRGDVAPFLCAIGWFVLCFAGLGISIWPTPTGSSAARSVPARITTDGTAGRMTRKLLWFIGLWAVGVAGVGAVAYGLRLLLKG